LSHTKSLILPIQFCRFYVAETVGIVGAQQEDVRGDELVVLHPNDVAYLNAMPLLVDQIAFSQHFGATVVHLTVSSMALLNKRSEVLTTLLLTMSSYASLTAVSASTPISGTAVVTGVKEEISGMS